MKTVLAATARRQPGRLLAWRHLRARPAPPPPELLEAVAEHMATADDFKEVNQNLPFQIAKEILRFIIFFSYNISGV